MVSQEAVPPFFLLLSAGLGYTTGFSRVGVLGCFRHVLSAERILDGLFFYLSLWAFFYQGFLAFFAKVL